MRPDACSARDGGSAFRNGSTLPGSHLPGRGVSGQGLYRRRAVRNTARLDIMRSLSASPLCSGSVPSARQAVPVPARCLRAACHATAPRAAVDSSSTAMISSGASRVVSRARPVAVHAVASAHAAEKEVYPGVFEGYWTWKGYNIRYQRCGTEGEAMVLVHGFGGNADHWRKVRQEMVAHA
jgi:hypothetical protein